MDKRVKRTKKKAKENRIQWRPEGWDYLEMDATEAIAKNNGMVLGATVGMVQSFEAGADAMLEVLRKMGDRGIGIDFTFTAGEEEKLNGKNVVGGGVIVFIPDDPQPENTP